MNPVSIIELEHCRGEPYANRSEAFAEMWCGEKFYFRARTDIDRASVRSAAYAFSRTRRGWGRRFHCHHLVTQPDILEVWRSE